MPPAAHRLFLERALPYLQADRRIVGVGAGGSWLTGTMDEYSDLDLVIACDSAGYDGVLRERVAIAERLGPLLNAFPGDHVHEPRLLICLYAPEPLHVDLKFVAVDALRDRVEDPVVLWERDGALTAVLASVAARFPHPDPQWIEDRFWTWIHYVAAKIGRGELFEAIGSLAFVRERVLGPLIHQKHGRLPRAVRRLESEAPEDAAVLAATVASHDRTSCIAATRATVRLYRALRDHHAAPELIRRGAAEAAAIEYLDRVVS
jgi:hypothetical protein